MDLQLKNKIALVTGSTAGIGFAIGSGLAGEGATVIIHGRRERVLRNRSPQLLARALRLDRRSGVTGYLHGESAFFRNQRCGVACRRWRYPLDPMMKMAELSPDKAAAIG